MPLPNLHLRSSALRRPFAAVRAPAAALRGRGFAAILGAIFAAHALLGGALMTRDAVRGWHPPEWDVAARAQASGLSRAAAAVAAVVPPRDTVLYATPSADDYRFWSYAMLSASLYPRTVWWSTPAARRSPIDWWVQAPFEVGAVLPVARRRAAAALLMDWNEESPPPGVDARAAHSGRLLLRLRNQSAGRAGGGQGRP